MRSKEMREPKHVANEPNDVWKPYVMAILTVAFCVSVPAFIMWLLTDYPLLACYAAAFGVELLVGMMWGLCCGDWWW